MPGDGAARISSFLELLIRMEEEGEGDGKKKKKKKP